MLIEFEMKEERLGDWSDFMIRINYKTRLRFSAAHWRYTFYGEAEDLKESALMAIQSFLDNEIHDHEVWTNRRFNVGGGYVYGPMQPEIKNIIQNAIDLKSGRGERILPETNGLA